MPGTRNISGWRSWGRNYPGMFSKIRDLGNQDQRMYELRGLIAGKQVKLVRLREVEEEEETPLRSRGTVTADATPQEAGSQRAGQHEAAGYRGEQGPHPQARPDRQVGGPDLVAVISWEGGEQTAEIGKAIDELRSFQVCHQGARRREEDTTQGTKIRGSRGQVEPRVEEPIKIANAGGRALKTKQKPGGPPRSCCSRPV